jgi:hypothetical protein
LREQSGWMGMKGMVQSALFVEVEVSGRFRHHNLLVMDIFLIDGSRMRMT